MDFLRYSSNEMSGEERNAFERNLQKDSFDEEAMEGLSNLSESELSQDLNELRSRISGKIKSGNRFNTYRLVAGLAILLSISSVFYFMISQRIERNHGKEFISETTELDDKEKLSQGPTKEILPVTGAQAENQASPETIIAEKNDLPPVEKKARETERIQIIAGNVEEEPGKPGNLSPNLTADKKEYISSPEATAAARAASGTSTVENKLAAAEESETRKYKGKTESADIGLKGATNSVVSDKKGAYEIATVKDDDSSAILQPEYMGMEKQELLAEEETEFNIVMNPSETVINETGKEEPAAASRAKLSKVNFNVQDDASPVKGYEYFEKYIGEQQKFPATKLDISTAKVILEFLVDKSGRPSGIKIIESPGKEFSDEAKRLLLEGPEWTLADPPEHYTRISINLSKE